MEVSCQLTQTVGSWRWQCRGGKNVRHKEATTHYKPFWFSEVSSDALIHWLNEYSSILWQKHNFNFSIFRFQDIVDEWAEHWSKCNKAFSSDSLECKYHLTDGTNSFSDQEAKTLLVIQALELFLYITEIPCSCVWNTGDFDFYLCTVVSVCEHQSWLTQQQVHSFVVIFHIHFAGCFVKI
jgi:hypothetical protein